MDYPITPDTRGHLHLRPRKPIGANPCVEEPPKRLPPNLRRDGAPQGKLGVRISEPEHQRADRGRVAEAREVRRIVTRRDPTDTVRSPPRPTATLSPSGEKSSTMIGWATESSCNRSKMAYRLANDDTSAMDDSPHSSRHASPPSVTHQPPVEAERRGIGRESSVSAIPSKYPALAAGNSTSSTIRRKTRAASRSTARVLRRRVPDRGVESWSIRRAYRWAQIPSGSDPGSCDQRGAYSAIAMRRAVARLEAGSQVCPTVVRLPLAESGCQRHPAPTQVASRRICA